MYWTSVRTIAQRELNETMTDWRILAPTFILTFCLPLVLIAATQIAVDFIDTEGTVAQLVPFVMMLVGFIPTSFSIITALEAFVGERERNSLESLLAMPISDTQLYLGKLISSLFPPLFSAFMGMCFFTVMLRITAPDLFAMGLNFRYATIILMLITTKAVVMVAGAVIISSHTTSIRAANLLASFVLLPTTALVQIEGILMLGNGGGWRVLQLIVPFLIIVAIALIRTGMGAFNREEILSREHEELSWKNIVKTFLIFLREYRPAGVQPDQYQGLSFSAHRFYRYEMPLLFREYRLPILIAAIAALSGVVAGGYIGQNYNVPVLNFYLENVGTSPEPSFFLSLYIFGNNIRVSLLSNILSLFLFGIFAFLVPAIAFAQVSFVANMLHQRGGNWLAFDADSPIQFLTAYVLPHGIIELPVAILGAAMGIRIGASLLSPPPGFSVGQNVLWAFAQYCKVWLFILLPGFLIGSMIEGLVTPHIISALYSG
ncbi:MAG: stage II sporulation protein M [Chloroflexota bacterium]